MGSTTWNYSTYQNIVYDNMPILAQLLQVTLIPQSGGSSQCSYRLCAMRFSAAPHDTDLWPFNCKLDYNFTAMTKPAFYHPAPGLTYFTMFTQRTGLQRVNCTFTLALSSAQCMTTPQKPGPFFTQSCLPLSAVNQTMNIDSSQPAIFQITPTSEYTNTLSYNVFSNSGSPLVVFEREYDVAWPTFVGSAGYIGVWDQNTSVPTGGNRSITIVKPTIRSTKPSLRYFLTVFAPSGAASINVSTTESICSGSTKNFECSATPRYYGVSTPAVHNITSKDFDGNGFFYAGVIRTGSDVTNIRIGVRRWDDKQPVPQLLVRLAAYPSFSQYDVVINMTTTPNGHAVYYSTGDTIFDINPWYIGIYNGQQSNVAYGIWFQSECPMDCYGHGQCVHHECQCDEDYQDGFWCQYYNPIYPVVPSDLRPYIISFTVIGSVLLGAFLCYYLPHMKLRDPIPGTDDY